MNTGHGPEQQHLKAEKVCVLNADDLELLRKINGPFSLKDLNPLFPIEMTRERERDVVQKQKEWLRLMNNVSKCSYESGACPVDDRVKVFEKHCLYCRDLECNVLGCRITQRLLKYQQAVEKLH
jgi:hypothetical protein